MTDAATESKEAPAADEPAIVLNKVYLKDVSLESPNAPDIFNNIPATKRPVMATRLGIRRIKIDDERYEVSLRMTIQASYEDQMTYFVLEVEQAGIFQVKNYTGEALKEALEIHCPRQVFPFVRQAVWTLVMLGGFPTLLINDIDFEALTAGRS